MQVQQRRRRANGQFAVEDRPTSAAAVQASVRAAADQEGHVTREQIAARERVLASMPTSVRTEFFHASPAMQEVMVRRFAEKRAVRARRLASRLAEAVS